MERKYEISVSREFVIDNLATYFFSLSGDSFYKSNSFYFILSLVVDNVDKKAFPVSINTYRAITFFARSSSGDLQS